MDVIAFLSPSPMEIAVIAVIALLVLGPSRLPDAARSLGKGMREMRNSFQGLTDDDDDDEDDRRLAKDDDPEDPGDDADFADLGTDEDDEDEDADTETEPAADTEAAPAAAPGRS